MIRLFIQSHDYQVAGLNGWPTEQNKGYIFPAHKSDENEGGAVNN